MNSIDSPLMTNAEAMAYCRIKDPRVWRRGYFPDFSSTQAARSYFTRRRCSRPMRRQRRITSCFASSTLSDILASSESNSADKRKLKTTGNLFLSFITETYPKALQIYQFKKSSVENYKSLDGSNGYYIMKLMIVQNIRISEELEAEISRLAEEIGESKQTAIRLALREGIEGVRRKFSKTRSERGAK